MASSSLTSRHCIPFSSFNPSRRRHLRRPFSVFCGSDKSEPPDRRTRDRMSFKLLEISVTLTVVSSSLPLSPAIAAAAKTSGKKRKKSSKAEGFSPEELKSWARDLPTVADRIGYTEIFNLRQEGKLKHIIKRPSSNLRLESESVLVVLNDLKVLRTVLPSYARDPKFWDAWDESNLNSVCINAYTPPVNFPAIPSPYLSFLSNLQKSFMSRFARRKPPKSQRALELERARKELVERRKATKQREEMIEKATAAQMREEKKKRDRELRQAKYAQRLRQVELNNQRMSDIWSSLANDQRFSTGLGIVFFYIFYRTVILSYRKSQKDYEDRQKIERAEAEERRKVKELERELAGQDYNDVEDVDEESNKEKDPYREIMKFMKSGARVRRAEPSRLPQYLDKSLDVKFSDVAGLGGLQKELEEIVKFFTHADIYRRRGVKIPG